MLNCSFHGVMITSDFDGLYPCSLVVDASLISDHPLPFVLDTISYQSRSQLPEPQLCAVQWEQVLFFA
jgi:hypothetical protein